MLLKQAQESARCDVLTRGTHVMSMACPSRFAGFGFATSSLRYVRRIRSMEVGSDRDRALEHDRRGVG